MENEKNIRVYGAKEHNLKNIDVSIPRNQLTVITGLSGSGKSSLAFDTIYAEGQRRYMETMSAYARQFLGTMERPDVDKITGLSPVISIEQKTTNKNPRSTVGTSTEIYDFLRLLYARAAEAFSYETGEKMVKYSTQQITTILLEKLSDKKIYLLAPLVKGRKGHYKELFAGLLKKGLIRVRVNGIVKEITPDMKLDRYKTHHIEVVIDRLKVEKNNEKRIYESLNLAMKHGKGVSLILEEETQKTNFFSQALMCPTTGISYNEPAPHSFSFNSPMGACPKCKGLGKINKIDIQKIIPNDEISIKKGAIVPLGRYKKNLIFGQIEAIADNYKFNLNTPIKDIPQEALDAILYGCEAPLKIRNTPLGITANYVMNFSGIVNYLQNENNDTEDTEKLKHRVKNFVSLETCSHCRGTRLKKEALYFKIDNKNIAELSSMNIAELYQWLDGLEKRMSKKQANIATEILKEIRTRLSFLLEVGLNYISLNRSSKSLSGGESQRIRLATQIGSQLVNILYILDEPSIGLHQRDNQLLLNSLKKLCEAQNTVIVVEHDKDMMFAAKHIIDMGPFAGNKGGELMVQGGIQAIKKSQSLTAQYLNGEKQIPIPEKRRKGNGQLIQLHKACGNNLKNVSVDFPLAKLICVTGVSGSGKSSLINETLHLILNQHFYNSLKQPLPYEKITGIEHIDKVIEVNQSPIGRTPRSNPATYTNMLSEIRTLFQKLPEAQIRGYKAGRFSFNVKGGRCETCKGAGLQSFEMNFLPDVYVKCNDCNGKRYNRETLEVRYKGKSISDVLNLTINQALTFFEHIPKITQKLKALQAVGLGYVTLGQPSTTLSGGESQRVKLATELAKKDTGKTLYILDEPTTGLHFEDIRILMKVLNKLVDKGNTVIIIEHNMDVIKMADYIIDMGIEGGVNGGEVVFQGTPEQLIKCEKSHTARYLKSELSKKTFKLKNKEKKLD